MLHGFDISGYQSSSWTAKTDMLFVKATENTGYTNPHFVSQFSAAKKLARVHGAYHFARPGSSSASAQADHFLAVIGPYLTANTLLVLDLEVSRLTQGATNQFAKDFAARLGHRYPSHRRVLYMGGGYSATNTGAGLSRHFHSWWYPRYPFAYQIAAETVDVEAWRAANRSDELSYDEIVEAERARDVARTGAASASARRDVLAALMTKWPPTFTPNAPAGKTGWSRPDIWQFTDNYGASHLDANISDRTVSYLLGSTQEDDMEPTTAVKISDYWKSRHQFSHDSYPASHLWAGALSETRTYGNAILAKLEAQQATIDKLADALGQAGSFDPADLKREIREAIESIEIKLDVPDAAPATDA